MSTDGFDATAPSGASGNASLLDASKMRAITISREYGSGGGEIAARLAKRLDWKLIDHEIVAEVASELGITHEEAEERDERADSIITRILTAMAAVEPAVFAATEPPLRLDMEDYRDALHRVVTVSAMSGHVVIMGRGAQVILRGQRDILHVRVVAPLDKRIAYVARREGLDAQAAQRRVQEKDRSRHQFVQSLYSANSEDAHLYDVVLNTGVLSLDAGVELICLALDRKAKQLSTPEDELGPGAGLARYAGAPADLPVPRPPDQP